MTVQQHSSFTAAASTLPKPLHVIIIGGGIGGLALAQGLQKSGVSVAVYERDRTPIDRVQGYRVHINPTGSRALYECLPPDLFDAFARTCGKPSQGIRFITEQGNVLLSLDGMDAVKQFRGDGVAQHRSVSRITLRRVLLSGLGDIMHFGKTFAHYEEVPDGVIAYFEDGTTAEGDILIAADGGGSRVRRQFLPQAQRIDTGILGIAGKVFLDVESRRRIAPEFLKSLTLVSGKGGCAFFVALQDIDNVAASDIKGIGGNVEPASAGSHFDNAKSYLMWAFGAKREKFGLGQDAETTPPEILRAAVLRAMKQREWDERFETLVRMADTDTINALPIRTSVPVAQWGTRRVTLLGDAIHSMTPYRGIGANVALKDAMRLCRALTAADRGERPVLEAIHDYETAMVDYGFRAVRTSLRAMNQAIIDSPVKSAVSRTALRIINRVPPFKQMMFSRIGEE
jgi:2-polyprenyl-6-methoxyphenol hydroxylase-like FAD-dependent oxidoreductase